MTQCVLPFKYEEEKNHSGMTALAGLLVYLDLAEVVGLYKSIKKHLRGCLVLKNYYKINYFQPKVFHFNP